MIKKTLSARIYKAGYEVRTEEYGVRDEKSLIVESAYTLDGKYIGNPKTAHLLCVKNGIKPELASETDCTCSIGFSEQKQKWFGWSHRAIYGFGIGDAIKAGDCTALSGWTDDYLAEHPEADVSLPVGFVAKDMDDAKRMAIAFADSVS